MGVHRKFTEDELVIATHNCGKFQEFKVLLEAFHIRISSAASFDLPEPKETGQTFSENAHIKAHAAAQGSGLPALADDSGLCVDALGGAPGIFSARWAGPTKDFDNAMQNIIDAIVDFESTRARFVCAIALCWPDGKIETFEGYAHGNLIWPPRGQNGFGYDPMFVPDGETKTFAEMSPKEKHNLSHRADAFRKLAASCFGNESE